jgi:subtilisin family serine protease
MNRVCFRTAMLFYKILNSYSESRARYLWKYSAIACFAGLAIQSLSGTAIAQPTHEPTLAPLINEAAPNRIPGQYIIVFKPDAARKAIQSAQERVKDLGGKVLHTYTTALSGFSITLPEGVEGTALPVLRALPGIEYIEADQMGTVNTIQPPNPPGNPPTGLDRIDRRLLPLNNTYTYSETGTGVHAYILDTGIRITNTEFGGRASAAFNAVMDGRGADTDCNGHGTNVAGIVGGATFGLAKQVTLHSVRVAQCSGSVAGADAISGVNWVTANATHPAVANMSLNFSGAFTSLDTAVTNSIAAGVTYTISAGNSNADACNAPPASVPTAITVGNIDPSNDARWNTSNFGTCLDLFAPGVNILSAGNTSDTATSIYTGTSQAAPHVAGVAVRYLQNHTSASPAAVWAAIHNADDVSTTAGWAGIVNSGAGSPNELLHWGSLNDGVNDGDPHLTTVDGVHYDFQSAGEFVALLGEGLEIQTRQTPIATTFIPGSNAYTGLATCVSVNSAVAARVGTHRVSYEPNISGIPDPSGMQLRVDGILTTLGAQGLDLGSGGRIMKSPTGNGIEIDFPNGTTLIVTPGWWASQGKWYLNVDAYHTPATEGIMGYIASGSWLPALPDGASLGPKPAAVHERYVDLYETFANAWRVTDATSLFDYAPGTSTANFTLKSWPKESPSSCVVPEQPLAQPLDARVAEKHCSAIVGKDRKADCVFDVMVTGNPGFAQTYLLTQQLRPGATETTVTDDKDPTQLGENVTFTATVAKTIASGGGTPTGTVQFILDGGKVEKPITLDPNGRAVWSISSLSAGNHAVSANYTPSLGGLFLASSSLDESHTVLKTTDQYFWLRILLLIILILIIIWAFRR